MAKARRNSNITADVLDNLVIAGGTDLSLIAI